MSGAGAVVKYKLRDGLDSIWPAANFIARICFPSRFVGYRLTVYDIAMTIVLSPQTETRLLAEATRRGIRADQLVEQLINAALPQQIDTKPNQASIDILNQWEAETATDDPEEINRRQIEFEQFKRELNQTRLTTDGPDARIPFP